jgi:copper transport protein
MVAVAAFSRAWVRGRLAGPDDEVPADDEVPHDDEVPTAPARPDLRPLRRSVAVEVAVAVVVLAVTAALVQSVPGRSALVPEPFETEVHGALVLLDATVDPPAAGPVEIDLQVADHAGAPLEPEEITASLTLPERRLGPLEITLQPDGVGHYVSTNAQIPFPGLWELDVTVRTTDVDQDLLNTPFTVG